MLDFEVQVQQLLPIPLPKVKFRSPDESSDKTDDKKTDNDVSAATPNLSDPLDDDPEIPSSST